MAGPRGTSSWAASTWRLACSLAWDCSWRTVRMSTEQHTGALHLYALSMSPRVPTGWPQRGRGHDTTSTIDHWHRHAHSPARLPCVAAFRLHRSWGGFHHCIKSWT